MKMNNRLKGNLAVASAIQRYVSDGYTVSLPLCDTARYDLVIERNGTFFAVQCKYAGYEGNEGIYSVPLYVSGGNRSAGNRRLRYEAQDFDILYVLCANHRSYAIPFAEVAGRTTINLGRLSKWSRWERYLLQSAGDNCSLAEGSASENSSNSVKPMEMVTPSQASAAMQLEEGVET